MWGGGGGRRGEAGRRVDDHVINVFTGSSREEDMLRRKVAEQLVTIERLERDKKERNEKFAHLEASSKKFGEYNIVCAAK